MSKRASRFEAVQAVEINTLPENARLGRHISFSFTPVKGEPIGVLLSYDLADEFVDALIEALEAAPGEIERAEARRSGPFEGCKGDA